MNACVVTLITSLFHLAKFWIQDNFLKKNKFTKADQNLTKFYIEFDQVQFEDEFELDQIDVEFKEVGDDHHHMEVE